MSQPLLYKYRSLDNWKFLLDILINKRLHAARFQDLNDPMEGRYYYESEVISREFRRAIRQEKDRLKVCSLSRNPLNTLMWSYYAGGHTGVVIGVSLRKSRNGDQKRVPMNYEEVLSLGAEHTSAGPSRNAIGILSQKQKAWEHEEEERIFTRNEFVNINIRKIYLGCKIGAADEELIRKLVKTLKIDVSTQKARRSDLDFPPLD